MSEGSDTIQEAVVSTLDAESSIVLTDVQIGSDGRLTIPAEKRAKYDLGEGDYIDAVLVPVGDDDGDGVEE